MLFNADVGQVQLLDSMPARPAEADSVPSLLSHHLRVSATTVLANAAGFASMCICNVKLRSPQLRWTHPELPAKQGAEMRHAVEAGTQSNLRDTSLGRPRELQFFTSSG